MVHHYAGSEVGLRGGVKRDRVEEE